MAKEITLAGKKNIVSVYESHQKLMMSHKLEDFQRSGKAQRFTSRQTISDVSAIKTKSYCEQRAVKATASNESLYSLI